VSSLVRDVHEFHAGWDGSAETYELDRVFGPGSFKVLGHWRTVAGVIGAVRRFEARDPVPEMTLRVARLRWFGFASVDDERQARILAKLDLDRGDQ
jgi:hypothetical protein